MCLDIIAIENHKLGTELHPDDRKHVLAAYVHRFTASPRSTSPAGLIASGRTAKATRFNSPLTRSGSLIPGSPSTATGG